LRPRLTYANVMSTLCFCLLLGGGAAYAATHLPKNSVGTKQIKKNAINGSKVADDSLTGSDIRESSLGHVPTADHATSSDHAASSDHATSSEALQGHTAADFLGANATAADSQKLGGLDSSAFVQGNGQVRSAQSDLSSGESTALFEIPGVGRLTVGCRNTNPMINDVTYLNLGSSTQSWTREVVDQGNGLLISGGDVAQNANTPTYSSGAFITDYSFHYLLAVYPPADSGGTAVNFDVTGMVFPAGAARCVTHGVAVVTP
jgi:hypothetical protein